MYIYIYIYIIGFLSLYLSVLKALAETSAIALACHSTLNTIKPCRSLCVAGINCRGTFLAIVCLQDCDMASDDWPKFHLRPIAVCICVHPHVCCAKRVGLRAGRD